jgi:hypothetical protein
MGGFGRFRIREEAKRRRGEEEKRSGRTDAEPKIPRAKTRGYSFNIQNS